MRRYSPASPPHRAAPLKLTIVDISTETRRGEIVARFAQAHQLKGGETPTPPTLMRSCPPNPYREGGQHKPHVGSGGTTSDQSNLRWILMGLWFNHCPELVCLQKTERYRLVKMFWCPETTKTTGSAF